MPTLEELISAPEHGVLLQAEHWVSQPVTDIMPTQAYFRLTSGWLQKEFICLRNALPRFDDYDAIVDRLVDKGLELKESLAYSAIITCTVTAKHLLDRIHARLESDPGEISVHYLGNFPHLTVENRQSIDFEHQRVLILADIVASGHMTRNLCQLVLEHGGKAVGVLALVATDTLEHIELADCQPGLREPALEPASAAEERIRHGYVPSVPVHVLAEHRIQRFKDEEIDGYPPRVIRIDPFTMRPENRPETGADLAALFSPEETVQQLIDTHSIRAGFFIEEDKPVCHLIEPEPLLQARQDVIWHRVQKEINHFVLSPGGRQHRLALVTTENRHDIAFFRFMQRHLQTLFDAYASSMTCAPGMLDKKPLVLAHADHAEAFHGYFLPDEAHEHVLDTRLILVFGSLTSEEKLFDIASLLASYGARSIMVLCLINRIGAADDFVRRMSNLLSGAMRNATSVPAVRFIPVYEMPEPGGRELARIRDLTSTLFDYYEQVTRVPAFRGWMQHERKYLTFRGASGRQPDTVRADADFVRYTALLGMRLTSEQARNRFLSGFQTVVDYLLSCPEREYLYPLLALLSEKTHGIQLIRQFWSLIHQLLDKLASLRQERFSLEQASESDCANADAGVNTSAAAQRALREHIEAIIEREVKLMTAIALLSHHDYLAVQSAERYQDMVFAALDCGRASPGEWLQTPLNQTAYFSEEKVAWSVSMLLHFSQGRFHKPEVAQAFKSRLAQHLLQYKAAFRQPGGGEQDAQRARANAKILGNIDFLLSEIGLHPLSDRQEVIRFLHDKLIYTRKGHNPMVSAIQRLNRALAALLDKTRYGVGEPAAMIHPAVASIPLGEAGSEKRKRYQKLVSESIYQAASLEQIAQVLPHFFDFMPITSKAMHWYTRDADASGFQHDVRLLRQTLQEIRTRNRFTESQFEDVLNRRFARISRHLYEAHSYLRRSLLAYITCLDCAVLDALDDVARKNAGHLRTLWTPVIAAWQPVKNRLQPVPGQQQAGVADALPLRFVLIDRSTLVELLKNLLSNARHAYPDAAAAAGVAPALAVEQTRIDMHRQAPYPAAKEPLEGYLLRFEYHGRLFPDDILPGAARNTTLAHQREEVRRFGGDLSWGNQDNGGGSWVQVQLIRRERPLQDEARNETDLVQVLHPESAKLHA